MLPERRVDFLIALHLNQLGLGLIDPATELFCRVSFLAALWSLLVVLALLLDRRTGRVVALGVLLALALHFLVDEGLLKHALLTLFPMRVRPYLAHPGEITPIGQLFTDSSFPSSHAGSTAAIMTVFGSAYRRWWAAAAGVCAAMCFARLHNGMHYPTDVLTGSLLGLGYGLLAVRLAPKISARLAAGR